MTDISELTNKYVVIPRKYLKKPNYFIRTTDAKIEVMFKDDNNLLTFCSSNAKYFVMKLQDEFYLDELVNKLNIYARNRDKGLIASNIKINGSDLSLLILNSITDLNKLL